MRALFPLVLMCVLIGGCTQPEPSNHVNAVVTFPVHHLCHDYIVQLPDDQGLYQFSFRPFTLKQDAFPHLSGFAELKSNTLMNLELQNKAIEIMDQCVARMKTTIAVESPSDWSDVGKKIQFLKANEIAIHSLVLEGTSLDVYYRDEAFRKAHKR